ncbi:MAG TPA: hypothetical protein VJC39_04430 [Candidatus Nanoarchaeia archaeon]|nr:hypothetical protein [Candidatus Nanoarchaeia archaeon]
MTKKCIVCSAEARYKIKDTSDFYCQECAQENFSDLDMLLKIEEEVQRLKDYLNQRLIKMEERKADRHHYKNNDDQTEDKNEGKNNE